MFTKILATGAVAASALVFAAAGAAPAMAAGPNLIQNGGFDGSGYDFDNGAFYEHQNFDGWVIGTPSGQAQKTLQVWYPEMAGAGAEFSAPFTDGPWGRVMGTISQRFPTEVGKTYTLTFDLRASGSDANALAAGWAGGNTARVGVDGVQLATYVTSTSSLYTTYSLNFTATDDTMSIFLGNVGTGAVGFDSVSVTAVDENDSPVMLPAIAGGIGMAALAAGSVFVVRRRKDKLSGE